MQGALVASCLQAGISLRLVHVPPCFALHALLVEQHIYACAHQKPRQLGSYIGSVTMHLAVFVVASQFLLCREHSEQAVGTIIQL